MFDESKGKTDNGAEAASCNSTSHDFVLSNFQERSRPVTYQLVLCGCDGLVIASDKRELRESGGLGDFGHGLSANMLSKIRIHNNIAWMFAGGQPSRVAAGYLEQTFQDWHDYSIEGIKQAMMQCGNDAYKHVGLGGKHFLILVEGPTKTILRADISPMTFVESLSNEGPAFGGIAYSLASLLPTRFYSKDMNISELAFLTACTVRMASDIDRLIIDGLDIAAYSDASGKFEFLDSGYYWQRVDEMDQAIRRCLLSHPAVMRIEDA